MLHGLHGEQDPVGAPVGLHLGRQLERLSEDVEAIADDAASEGARPEAHPHMQARPAEQRDKRVHRGQLGAEGWRTGRGRCVVRRDTACNNIDLCERGEEGR